jgi:hypothetical protein
VVTKVVEVRSRPSESATTEALTRFETLIIFNPTLLK